MTLAPSPHTTPDIENACESEIEPGDCTGGNLPFRFYQHFHFFLRKFYFHKKITKVLIKLINLVFMRYGFDIHTGECRQFQYGGCGGNGNNFGSMSECKRKCLNKSSTCLFV